MARAKALIGSVVREKPSITIDAKQLPEVKNWKIGKRYQVVIDAELIGLNKDEWDESTPLRARFRVHGVKEYEDE